MPVLIRGTKVSSSRDVPVTSFSVTALLEQTSVQSLAATGSEESAQEA